MPRRARVQRRNILPDPIYASPALAKFINCVMLAGKKSTAQRIVYDAFEKVRKDILICAAHFAIQHSLFVNLRFSVSGAWGLRQAPQ